MSFSVIQTFAFQKQLEQILDYIETAFSKEYAYDYLTYLEKQVDNLKEFPNLGKKICLKTSTIKPTNAFISKKNIVFYRVNEEEKTIVLIAITNSDQNYLNLMN